MLPQFLAGGFGSLGDGVELLPHGTQRVGEHEPPIAAGLPAQGVVADEVAGLAVAQQFQDARGPVPGERGRSAVHGLRHAQAVGGVGAGEPRRRGSSRGDQRRVSSTKIMLRTIAVVIAVSGYRQFHPPNSSGCVLLRTRCILQNLHLSDKTAYP